MPDKMKLAMLVTTSSLLLLSRTAAAFSPWATRNAAKLPVAMFATTTNSHAAVQDKVDQSKLFKKFSDQVTVELSASQLYLSASLWCNRQELTGMEAYMRAESDDERAHAMEFLDFANKKKYPLVLQELEPPPSEWGSVEELWTDLLEAEHETTQSINELAEAAEEANDRALEALLDDFHMEQVEEVNHLRTILAKVRDQSQTPGLLRQLDSELAPGGSSAKPAHST